MSETSNATETRQKFTIDVGAGIGLAPITSGVKITSQELCQSVADYFSVFKDFIGCNFIVGNGAIKPYIAIYFDHGDYADGDLVGVKKGGDKQYGNDIIDRSRRRDRIIASGDRYFLTEDAKDILEQFVPNRPGQKIDWRNFTSEITQVIDGQQIRCTMVSNISIEKLCAALKLIGPNEDNDEYEYSFAIDYELTNNNFIAGMNLSRNYMLMINKASGKEVDKVYQKLGFISNNIVRPNR